MSHIAFELPKNKSNTIKVIGVGGGGSNAVDYMYKQDIKGVDFVVCNTDAQALETSPIPNKIQLGITLTEGMGAGANPEIGAQAAQESYEELKKLLDNKTKMVFITAGMGGGTGTGAAPIIAGIAKDLGLLTVGIVTMPFEFEGKRRSTEAQKGIKALRENVDSLIVINNNKLGEVYGDLGYKSGFAKADEVLSTAARGIAEVITHHYKQNIDLNDAKTVLANSGTAIMGSADAEGENRAFRAISGALDSPLLNDNRITGAKNVLLLIVSGTREITLNEIGEINEYIRQEAGHDVNIILGIGDDESIGESIAVTVIATGFSSGQQYEISELEAKKIVHVLEDDQPIQFDLFSSEEEQQPVRPFQKRPKAEVKEEKVVFNLEEDIEKIPLSKTSDFIENIEVSFDELSQTEPEEFVITEEVDELIPTTDELYNMEVIYDEVVAEVLSQERQVFNLEDEKEDKSQTSLNFEFSVSENKSEGNEIVKHNLEDFEEQVVERVEQIHIQKETEELDRNLQLELKIFDKEVTEEKPNIWNSTANNSNGSHEEISPLNMSISEFKKTTEERKIHLKKHNYTFHQNPSNIDELEREPAFKRMNIDIDNNISSVDSNQSRTTIELDENNDLKIRTDNSFLHDNVD